MIYRQSQHRQAILRVVKFSAEPMTSGEIHRRLPRVPEATLFRNLERLVERGEIFLIDGIPGKRGYVGHTWHEAEFTCVQCGKKRHLKHRSLPGYVDRKMFGHQEIFTTQLMAQGRCGTCAKKGPRR